MPSSTAFLSSFRRVHAPECRRFFALLQSVRRRLPETFPEATFRENEMSPFKLNVWICWINVLIIKSRVVWNTSQPVSDVSTLILFFFPFCSVTMHFWIFFIIFLNGVASPGTCDFSGKTWRIGVVLASVWASRRSTETKWTSWTSVIDISPLQSPLNEGPWICPFFSSLYFPLHYFVYRRSAHIFNVSDFYSPHNMHFFVLFSLCTPIHCIFSFNMSSFQPSRCRLTQRGTRAGVAAPGLILPHVPEMKLLVPPPPPPSRFLYIYCMYASDFHALTRNDVWKRINLHFRGSVITRLYD